MIVEPDFLDHWKTQMLVGFIVGYSKTNPEAPNPDTAPLMVLRLWGFCQQRRAWIFPDMTNAALAAICRWKCDPSTLRQFLTDAGWLDKDDTQVVVHQWNEVNSKLVANWQNGPLGGRPIKAQAEPIDTPRITQRKPTHNPPETHEQASLIPQITDQIEKRREDQTEKIRTPQPPDGGSVCEKVRLRICGWHGRKPDTEWGSGELKSLQKVMKRAAFDEEVGLVEKFYTAIAPPGFRYAHKGTILAMLNNWAGELDKARKMDLYPDNNKPKTKANHDTDSW